jgi:hypothetical protein
MPESRLACPAHNGLADQVRAVLRESDKPLTLHQIAFRVGTKPERVRNAVSDMVSRSGQVVSVKTSRGYAYALYSRRAPQPKPQQSGNVAGPKLIRGYIY